MTIHGKTPWQFACEWYTVDSVMSAIRHRAFERPVPKDVESIAFAEWLVNEYRLALAKGIEVATRELKGGV